ncbi:hypothetical protein RhiirA4_484203 [Rhizophagus irregularis]|uniref:Uncharacterized protein n=1 Tax=Rhizophagus irregularis TaxID=588596 RepID=A0A2I1HNK9_9GLOM|nr:hypothetical protein RhiirA4_484203 [Rhizophagus irregularis]
MSNMGDLVRNPNNAEDFLRFISNNGDFFLHGVTAQLGSFVENGFLKTLFDKSPQAYGQSSASSRYVCTLRFVQVVE